MPTNLPANRREDLSKIVDIVSKEPSVDMLILFGSHARGDWVSDVYREGHITYEYDSDYDLLVLVANEDIKNDISLWRNVEKEIRAVTNVTVNLLVDSIKFVNNQIEESNYFYLDIKNEGIILYDTGKFHLTSPSSVRSKQMLIDDLNFWKNKASDFLKDYEHNIKDGALNNAAFHLSQATESLYFAILVVFTGYKLKSHNIGKIAELAEIINPKLKDIFPEETDDQKRMFDLLKKAYIDARYKQNYEITLDQLKYLEIRIKVLFELVTESCLKYIDSYNGDK